MNAISNDPEDGSEYHTPHECVLIYTLPRTREAYQADLAAGDAKDFARSIERETHGAMPMQGFNLRLEDQIRAAEGILDQIEGTNVRVARDVGIDTLSSWFHGARVVTLVAHWSGDAVELRDGLYAPADIARSIPQDFQGLIDLTVCQSETLGDTIKAHRPDINVQVNRDRTGFVLRLLLYREVIRRLTSHPQHFMSACVATRVQLLHALESEGRR